MNTPFSKPKTIPGGWHSNLGDILVEIGVISEEQLSQAISAAGGPNKDISKWLIELGFTTEEKIMKAIGIKARVPYFTSLEGLYTRDSENILSEELARRLQVVPLFRINNVATMAMINPLDVFVIDALVKTTGMRIDPVVCTRSIIFETINKVYGGFESSDMTSLPPEPQHAEVLEPEKIAVSNGAETLYIDPKDEAAAAQDGYRRIS